ncbi:hypothetical protein [Desulfocurvibacter africanus]|uniref:Uncharacterized protein n=1 Tax=Desulfocurvibacter africanus subsp. africanus str. Walvis Bay TaxID=690850 RepID=F3YXG8_DESAF|nr:hypothetical protein [Desulfocurvibacter africanus]EGJ51745.1 hypothetical protein Desaf_3461 [Desulfocurvibacter africanus subsp. africanus str. Walvis Bay]
MTSLASGISGPLRVHVHGLSLGFVALALLVAGCSTAASMRVDVEVYKGPLSKPFSQQWGEFKGILSEAHAAFCNTESIPALNRDFTDIKISLFNLIKQAEPICGNLDAAICSPKKLTKADPEYAELKAVLSEAAKISTRMKSKAIQWPSILQSGETSTEYKASIPHYCILASEYSNQISSRADLLALQLDHGNITSALSYYLRDSKPTLFPYLKVWNEQQNTGLQSTARSEETAKAFELLFADHYWSKINTVFANGQGEFQMALIKDDIGNWTLKSYANDPSELVQGYRDLTMEAIEETTDLAANMSSSGVSGRLEEALDITSRLTAGRLGGDSAAPIDIGVLHRNVVAQIEQISLEGEAAQEKIRTILEDYQRTLVVLEAASLGSQVQEPAKQAPAASAPAGQAPATGTTP